MEHVPKSYELTRDQHKLGADLRVEGVANVVQGLALGDHILDRVRLQVQSVLGLLAQVADKGSSRGAALDTDA